MYFNKRKYSVSEKTEDEKDILLHAFASSREGIVIVDENGLLEYFNQAYADIFGYEPDELYGKSWKDLVASEDHAAGEDLLKATCEKRGTEGLSREFMGIRKDGKHITIEAKSTAMLDNKCGNKGFVCFISDVSDRKKAEQELFRLKRAVETSGEVVFMIDENGVFTYINPEFTRLYGYKSEEVIGKLTPRILKSELLSQEEIGRLLVKMKNREVYRGSWVTQTKSGQKIYVDHYASPIIDEEGNFSGYLVMERDVTESVKASNALKASAKLLADIINSLPEPTFVINKDHQVIIWNKALETFTGIKAEDIIMKDGYLHTNAIFGETRPMAADMLLDPDAAYENMYLSFQRFEKTIIAEINALIPSKSEDVYLWSIASKLNDAQGNLIGAIQTLRDITGLKKIEQELRLTKEKTEEHNRLKSYFIANMSHELRTPLVGILGFSEILLSEIEDEDTREKVKIIFDSGKRLMETLNSILDFSKLESNRYKIHAEKINIPGVVEGIIKIYEPSASGKNLSLMLDIKDQNITARLDESIFLQTLKNIISNSVKFTVKGWIKVTVVKEYQEDNSQWVTISVEDTGIGISPENQKFIFEPFRQASEGFNRKYEGTGLGLSLTKKFVELMHGKISLTSKEGEGTSVRISIPLYEEENPQAPDKKEDDTKNLPYDKENLPVLLFVEDDVVSQRVMKLFLKGLCSVDIAPDGETALQLIRKKEYCAVLMDMNLGGGLNGLETTAAIREIPRYKSVPVIAVTAYATASEKERILSQGCDHFISKPFTSLDITSLIKRILEI